MDWLTTGTEVLTMGHGPGDYGLGNDGSCARANGCNLPMMDLEQAIMDLRRATTVLERATKGRRRATTGLGQATMGDEGSWAGDDSVLL